MCAVVSPKWGSTGANEGFRPILNSLNVKNYRKLLLVGIFRSGFAARRCKVLKVVAAEVHTEQLPQNELRWVVAAVVVRNQTMPQHQQGREIDQYFLNAHNKTNLEFFGFLCVFVGINLDMKRKKFTG